MCGCVTHKIDFQVISENLCFLHLDLKTISLILHFVSVVLSSILGYIEIRHSSNRITQFSLIFWQHVHATHLSYHLKTEAIGLGCEQSVQIKEHTWIANKELPTEFYSKPVLTIVIPKVWSTEFHVSNIRKYSCDIWMMFRQYQGAYNPRKIFPATVIHIRHQTALLI